MTEVEELHSVMEIGGMFPCVWVTLEPGIILLPNVNNYCEPRGRSDSSYLFRCCLPFCEGIISHTENISVGEAFVDALPRGGHFLMKLAVQGGNTLRGSVRIGGAKNAALVLIAASAVIRGEVILDNVPRIADVETQLEIVRALGGQVEWLEQGRVLLDWPDQFEASVPYQLAKKLRASNLFLGALAARIGHARIPLPGGCDIGSRPMDLHLKGLSALGFEVELEHGFIEAKARETRGNRIYLDFPSVGATENIMMAAVGIPGTTIVENAAKEPEIVDLASFLGGAGATIRGAGTDLIKIEGNRARAGHQV